MFLHAGLFHKSLQQLALDQAQVRSLELHPGLPHTGQEPEVLSRHPLSLPSSALGCIQMWEPQAASFFFPLRCIFLFV